MATLDDVARTALALPEVTEDDRQGRRSWSVGTKCFAWERPFSKADVKRFGSEPVPEGPIVAVRTADLGEKEAVLAASSPACFTIPHFDGYSAVLVQISEVPEKELHDVVLDGWLACAPARLTAGYEQG